jgi:hypothetical protein
VTIAWYWLSPLLSLVHATLSMQQWPIYLSLWPNSAWACLTHCQTHAHYPSHAHNSIVGFAHIQIAVGQMYPLSCMSATLSSVTTHKSQTHTYLYMYVLLHIYVHAWRCAYLHLIWHGCIASTCIFLDDLLASDIFFSMSSFAPIPFPFFTLNWHHI